MPHAGISPGYAGGHPISQLRSPAVVVDASYHLDNPSMIAWWWALHESSRGQPFVAMLDTSGYIDEHICAMVAAPDFRSYNGTQAVVSVQWVCPPKIISMDNPLQTESGIDFETETGETLYTEGVAL